MNPYIPFALNTDLNLFPQLFVASNQPPQPLPFVNNFINPQNSLISSSFSGKLTNQTQPKDVYDLETSSKPTKKIRHSPVSYTENPSHSERIPAGKVKTNSNVNNVTPTFCFGKEKLPSLPIDAVKNCVLTTFTQRLENNECFWSIPPVQKPWVGQANLKNFEWPNVPQHLLRKEGLSVYEDIKQSSNFLTMEGFGKSFQETEGSLSFPQSFEAKRKPGEEKSQDLKFQQNGNKDIHQMIFMQQQILKQFQGSKLTTQSDFGHQIKLNNESLQNIAYEKRFGSNIFRPLNGLNDPKYTSFSTLPVDMNPLVFGGRSDTQEEDSDESYLGTKVEEPVQLKAEEESFVKKEEYFDLKQEFYCEAFEHKILNQKRYIEENHIGNEEEDHKRESKNNLKKKYKKKPNYSLVELGSHTMEKVGPRRKNKWQILSEKKVEDSDKLKGSNEELETNDLQETEDESNIDYNYLLSIMITNDPNTLGHENPSQNFVVITRETKEGGMDSTGEDKFRNTRVGSRYQASIPSVTKAAGKRKPPQQVWSPESVDKEELDGYFGFLCKALKCKIINEERAIKLLKRKDYKRDKVQVNISKNEKFYSSFLVVSDDSSKTS